MTSKWRRATLGVLIELQRGHDLTDAERSPGSVPVIGGGGPNGSHAVASVKGPGVAIGRSGAGFGKAWWSDQDYWAHNTVLFVKDFKGNDPRFVYYVLDSIDFTKFNSGGAQPSLNRNFIYPIDLLIPPIGEQKRIACVLRTWDEAIEKADALLRVKSSRYVGMRRMLIAASTAQSRGPVRLTEITHRVRRTNDGNGYPVMTISAKAGFLLQSDKYARDMAGSSVQAYTVLRRGEFAYNKGNSLTSPQGCIFRLTEECALVPHVYLCFALDAKQYPDFYVHVFESGYLNHQLSRVINSGVRNDGLLNLAAEDFFNCRVPAPSPDEQIRIARVLNGLRSELELHEKLLQLLRKQKRGLMQKLLIGQWRVKADGGAL